MRMALALPSSRVWTPRQFRPALWLRPDRGITVADFWQNVVNVTVAGTSLTKTGGVDGAWDAGASTSQALFGDGWVRFRADAIYNVMCGLSVGDAGQGVTEIDYAIYTTGTHVQIYENGVGLGEFALNHVASDLFEIRVTGTVVTYWRNGLLLYTSLVAATFPLLVDTSFFDVGGELWDVTLSGAVQKASALADLSGHGFDVAQATANKRPYIVPGPPAGLRFVRAAETSLVHLGAIAPLTAYTVLAVAQRLSLTESVQCVLANGFNDGSFLMQDANHMYVHHYDLAVLYSDVTFERAHWDGGWDGTNLRIRRNASAWNTTPSGMRVPPTVSLTVGSSYTGGAYWFEGLIHEIVFVPRVLSDGELAQFSAYCHNRYGVA